MPSCNTSPGITSNPSGTSGGLKERRSWPRSNEPGRQPLAKIKLSLLFKRRMTSTYTTTSYPDASFSKVPSFPEKVADSEIVDRLTREQFYPCSSTNKLR